MGAQAALFPLVDKKFRIHRKKDSGTAVSMDFPLDAAVPGLSHRRPIGDASGAEKALQAEASRIVLDRYSPPGVVVDQDMQVVQFRGQTGDFLEPAPGEASLHLLKMAREGLLYGLRRALQLARKSRATVRKEGLQVRSGNGWKPVSLVVVPLTTSGRPYYLVLFEEFTTSALQPEPPARERKPRAGARREETTRASLLQRELAASREYLQSIIQELEAANEELQSANEEILSSNEEPCLGDRTGGAGPPGPMVFAPDPALQEHRQQDRRVGTGPPPAAGEPVVPDAVRNRWRTEGPAAVRGRRTAGA